jgi:hypothetical protein
MLMACDDHSRTAESQDVAERQDTPGMQVMRNTGLAGYFPERPTQDWLRRFSDAPMERPAYIQYLPWSLPADASAEAVAEMKKLLSEAVRQNTYKRIVNRDRSQGALYARLPSERVDEMTRVNSGLCKDAVVRGGQRASACAFALVPVAVDVTPSDRVPEMVRRADVLSHAVVRLELRGDLIGWAALPTSERGVFWYKPPGSAYRPNQDARFAVPELFNGQYQSIPLYQEFVE